jgi:plastocyanin
MKLRPPLKSWLPVLALLVIAAALLAACGGDSANGSSPTPTATETPTPTATETPTPTESPGSGGGATVEVSIKDFAFTPAKIEIEAGTTVVWTNEDSVIHTVTSATGDDLDSPPSGLFDSGNMEQGDTFSYTFDEPGGYDYFCIPHATMRSMHAEVEVK